MSATGPHCRWGGAQAPYKRFAHRQNLDAGRIHSARADSITGVPNLLRRLGLADAMIWQGVSY
ncbi:hypothetical protein B5G40_09275 [Flavonifractor sp. An9]|nr:hypothetical protein B5G40_09275 [Flavonifractor sp. An9]OUN13885.1 hypothetical protein B5G42_04305 [Flavonifractor sp. An91]